jgi:hypothetical protein
MGVIEWSAVGAVLTAAGLIGGWVWRLAWRLAGTTATAKSAEIHAAGLSVKISNLEHDLAEHREHVAAEYVSRDALKDVTQAINRLADRLDNLFLQFMPKQ